MSLQSWVETLTTAQSASTALTNTVAETSILPADMRVQLASQFAQFIGKAVRVTLLGQISILNPTPGNLSLALRFGATDVFSSSTMALNALASKTNVGFKAELYATVRKIGSTGNLIGQWVLTSEAVAQSSTAGLVGVVFGPASAPVVGSSIDLTAANTFDIQATWSIASASNSITVLQAFCEAMN